MDSKIRGVANVTDAIYTNKPQEVLDALAALPHVAKAYLESQVSMKAIKQLAAVLEED